ncbi:hypothetical protein MRB53_041937 [Persea americana]|nr:hypothetical protein MRB53_041937 [Persea americana]
MGTSGSVAVVWSISVNGRYLWLQTTDWQGFITQHHPLFDTADHWQVEQSGGTHPQSVPPIRILNPIQSVSYAWASMALSFYRENECGKAAISDSTLRLR